MLYIVPTPIGNLGDITLRAIEILKTVDCILAEDTRVSGKLLQHLEISKPLKSYHAHNEHKLTDSLIEQLKAGKTFALISDAGTPAISDPGFLLTKHCIDNGIEVQCLPGPTAFVPALVASGLPCDKFIFEGFLPHKKGRQTRLKILAEETRTIVLYESPYRVLKTLKQLIEFLGEDRQACTSREISKKFEEHKRGTLKELAVHFELKNPKGEFVICVAGKEKEKKKR